MNCGQWLLEGKKINLQTEGLIWRSALESDYISNGFHELIHLQVSVLEWGLGVCIIIHFQRASEQNKCWLNNTDLVLLLQKALCKKREKGKAEHVTQK